MMLAAAPTLSTEPISFQKQIMPIFEQRCASCHSRGALGDLAVQLDLSSYAGIAARSSKGVVVIPYHADNSPIMRVIDSNWRLAGIAPRMPPFGPKLSPTQIDLIRQWINQGAKDN